jgi:hypothetical protein
MVHALLHAAVWVAALLVEAAVVLAFDHRLRQKR